MTSPNVLGLDLSLSQSGAARIHADGWVETWRHPTDPLPADAPIAAVAARIHAVARWAVGRGTTATVLAVIEAPSHGSTFGQPHERAGIWWAVARGLDRAGVPIGSVAPKTLKHRITGSGGASKAEVRRAVAALYPQHGLARISSDEADAVALATLGVARLAAHHGPDGPWTGPWLGQHALSLTTGCRWPDLGPPATPPAPPPAPIATPRFQEAR